MHNKKIIPIFTAGLTLKHKTMETLNRKEQAILAILESYPNLTVVKIVQLIEQTNEIGGCSFVSLKGYSSEKSNGTELADYLVNVGASYKNMVKKDVDIYANFDLSTVDVDKFDYSTIDTKKLTLEQFKQAVKEALPIALDELQQPKAKRDTSADFWLNKVLVFNFNTNKLRLMGQSINKTTQVKGEFKVVASAPKTIAKRLIEKQANSRSASLRGFTIENFVGSVKVNGETLLIE